MKWLDSIPLPAKLITLMGLIFFTVMLLGAIAYLNMTSMKKNLDNIYFGNLMPVVKLKDIIHTYSNGIIGTIHKHQAGLLSSQQTQQKLIQSQHLININWQGYKKIYKTKEEMTYINYADGLLKDTNAYLSQIILLYERNNKHGLSQSSTSRLFTIIDRTQKTIKKIINYELAVARSNRSAVINTYDSTLTQLMIISTLLIIVSSIISIPIMTNIQTSQQMILETKAELEEKNVELLNASITDAMTGAYNRRYFDEMFDKEYKRAIRDKKPYTFFLLDIDFFKQYNDTYGHQAGDQTLIKVAGVLQNNLRRPGDFAFRIGGEEFGGILSNTTTQEAMMITKKILTAIEELHIEHIGNKASKYVTASIGIMSATPSDRIDAKEWIELADEALYDAKDSGRNRVIVSSGERKAPSKKEDNVQIANNQTYIMEKTDEKTQQTMG